MLASVYTDDEERGNAIGIALGGLAMGVLGVYCMFRILTCNTQYLVCTGTTGDLDGVLILILLLQAHTEKREMLSWGLCIKCP